MKSSLRTTLLLLALLIAFSSCSKRDEGDSSVISAKDAVTTAEPTATEEETTRDPDAVEPYYPKLDPIQFNKESISITVEESVLLHRSENQAFGYNAWPSICQDENGVLYAAFSGDRLSHVCPYGQNLMAKSTDGGKTWQPVSVINDSVMDDRDTGLLYVGNGKMIVSYFCHGLGTYLNETERANILNTARENGVYDEVLAKIEDMEANPDKYNKQGNYIRISEDYGETWGEPIKVPTSSPHGPILHSSGDLMYLGKIAHDTNYADAQMALFRSSDQGKTWQPVSRIPIPYGLSTDDMWELSLVELADGGLMAAIRVQNVVKDMEFTVYTCHSGDGGKTWTDPAPTGLCGSPPHLLRLSDGSILLSYSRRDYPMSIRAVISTDGGRTWSEELILDDDAPNGDMGYPCTVELADHTLVTVFYRWASGDKNPSVFSVRWKLN